MASSHVVVEYQECDCLERDNLGTTNDPFLRCLKKGNIVPRTYLSWNRKEMAPSGKRTARNCESLNSQSPKRMRTRIIRSGSASYFVVKIVNKYANHDATTPLRIASPYYSRFLCHVTLLPSDRFALCGSFFFRFRRFGNIISLLEVTIECFVA